MYKSLLDPFICLENIELKFQKNMVILLYETELFVVLFFAVYFRM